MLFFQRVELTEFPTQKDPLYVGHFFDLQGMWWRKRRERQEMIFSVAITWYRIARKQLKCPGMLSDELNLTGLTSKVREARMIVEHFFEITKLGYNFNDGTNYAPTVVRPRKLPQSYITSIERYLHKVVFNPGKRPPGTFKITKVRPRKSRAEAIREKLKSEARDDLLPAVNWVLEQDEIEFMYRSSGKLQARETSVWPIKAIELWPGWLRAELFGTTIDLENAFCQYLLDKLTKISDTKSLSLRFPDLIRAVHDKKNFREEICRELKMVPHEENITIVKKILMALANGSNCTAGLMTSDSRSEVVRIIKQAQPDLLPTEMVQIGDRLQSIARQFRGARKQIVLAKGLKPTKDNVKKVFHDYFEWEKDARNAIWEALDRTGLQLHDGIDGGILKESAESFKQRMLEQDNLVVSVDE